MVDDLDRRLLAAHAAGDKQALVTLYTEAADAATDDTARGFYMTHAYVYALDIGDPRASALHKELKAMKREA